MLVRFDSIPVGTKIRLENLIGEKVEPIECESSRKFYESQGGKFYGWNFYQQFCGFGEWNHCSLAPETLVKVL